MFNRIGNIGANESAANTSETFKSIAKLIPYLTGVSLNMNDTISSKCYEILNAISKKSDAFGLAIQSNSFADDFLRSVSNLYEYNSMRIEDKIEASKVANNSSRLL